MLNSTTPLLKQLATGQGVPAILKDKGLFIEGDGTQTTECPSRLKKVDEGTKVDMQGGDGVCLGDWYARWCTRG